MHRYTAILLRSCLLLLAIMIYSPHAHARGLIRDAEVEDTLRRLTNPILSAAGIEPSSVRIFIINDPSLNAFVAGGMNIFFHTGLILNADKPDMLVGVIAHETGHIAGAHLTQLSGISENASIGALMSTILGAAAAIGGAGDAGAAIISAGQNTSMRQLLSHYRGNEQQADQAAVRYLRTIGLSPQGMLDMFELLRRKERQHISSGGDPYLRTHPLTRDRISAMRTAVREAEADASPLDASLNNAHQRMVAKLYAFLEEPNKTFVRYPATDTSAAGHLARAVAWFRLPDLQKALVEADQLIARSPDAFAYDLKGQILFENGQIDAAIDAYRQSVAILPENGLIQTDLGKAYLAKDTPDFTAQSIGILERATRLDTSNSSAFHHLAIAYGKQGELGKSYLALAQEAALSNNPQDMIDYANRAKEHAPNQPELAIIADDLIADAKRIREREQGSLF